MTHIEEGLFGYHITVPTDCFELLSVLLETPVSLFHGDICGSSAVQLVKTTLSYQLSGGNPGRIDSTAKNIQIDEASPGIIEPFISSTLLLEE